MTYTTKQFGRVGVLMGGISSEREISLRSGKAVAQALSRQGCDVVPLDISGGESDKILSLLQGANIDVAFIALHGRLGEDGGIQAILGSAGIPYTGSGVDASRLAIDKALAQPLFKKNGISVPSHVIVSKDSPLSVDAMVTELGIFPFVVKPACEGSSIGINLAHTHEELQRALREAWRYGDTVLVERYIEGRELTVGILEEEALPVVEIRPKCRFFDFEAKYTKGMADYFVPAGIPEDAALEIRGAALQAHRLLGCVDFSRVDFMLDARQAYYLLEVNTIPGFTSTSLLPKAAGRRGMSFDQLCLKLVELAYGKKEDLKETPLRY